MTIERAEPDSTESAELPPLPPTKNQPGGDLYFTSPERQHEWSEAGRRALAEDAGIPYVRREFSAGTSPTESLPPDEKNSAVGLPLVGLSDSKILHLAAVHDISGTGDGIIAFARALRATPAVPQSPPTPEVGLPAKEWLESTFRQINALLARVSIDHQLTHADVDRIEAELRAHLSARVAPPALQEGADWSLLEATQASLREHMQMIRIDRAAAQECVDWLSANRLRLHAPDCSFHEPSARCSCGLNKVLSYTRAISNGTTPMFVADPLSAAPKQGDQ